MTTFVDYVKEFGDLSFEQRPFCDVDCAILTELLYLEFDEICANPTDTVTIATLGKQFLAKKEMHQEDNAFLVTQPRLDLLEVCSQAPRFRELEMMYFVNEIDAKRDKQFAATTYQLNPHTHLIVFRGTDDTLIGWKEDFMLSYLTQVPAQAAAMDYLSRMTHTMKGNFYVSGHSKGGNLAIYAATMATYNKERLLSLYAFDSPGFHESFLQQEAFREIKEKLHYYIPTDAIVGEIMTRPVTPSIIKSRQHGLLQHDSSNWEVVDGKFTLLEETSNLSQIIKVTLSQWLEHRNVDELEFFVTHLFQIFEQANIASLNDLSQDFWGSLANIRKVVNELEPELKKTMDENLNHVMELAQKNIVEHQQEQFKSWQQQFDNWLHAITPEPIKQLFHQDDTITLTPPK